MLRAGEVAGLVLDNLDWRAGERTAGERAAARIDNYLGFPAGISGAELKVRIPKLRQGSYFRSWSRAGEAGGRFGGRPASLHLRGPTRRVDQLVESLGVRVSRSGAVRICARHAIGAASTQDWKRRWSI